ncbi:hypothetical protein COOONC_06003 [Cooperia oncophora]
MSLISGLCENRMPLVLVGDFNLLDISWSRLSHKRGTRKSHFVESHNFKQLVLEPTHDYNILDLVLTNCPSLISSTSVRAPFSTSDHATVSFNCPRVVIYLNKNEPLTSLEGTIYLSVINSLQ